MPVLRRWRLWRDHTIVHMPNMERTGRGSGAALPAMVRTEDAISKLSGRTTSYHQTRYRKFSMNRSDSGGPPSTYRLTGPGTSGNVPEVSATPEQSENGRLPVCPQRLLRDTLRSTMKPSVAPELAVAWATYLPGPLTGR